MVTGSIATYFVDKLSKPQEGANKTVVDEQLEYVKSKLDEIEELKQDEVVMLNETIMKAWEVKRNNEKKYLKESEEKYYEI